MGAPATWEIAPEASGRWDMTASTLEHSAYSGNVDHPRR